MFLILLITPLTFKKRKKVILFTSVLTGSYFLAIFFATYTRIEFNVTILKFIILLSILLLSVAKIFNLKNRFIKLKKRHYMLLCTAIFGFFNGLGSLENFILEIGVSESKFIPVIEVFLGFITAIIIVVLLLLTLNTVFQRFVKIDKVKWDTVLSVIMFCIAITLMSKLMLH